MSSEAQFNFVADDLLPFFEFTFDFEDEDTGKITPIPLTNFTSIKLRMRRSDGKLIVIDHTDVDAANGEGRFEWSDGDLIRGIHRAEIRRITTGTLLPQTIPSKPPMIFDLRDLV